MREEIPLPEQVPNTSHIEIQNIVRYWQSLHQDDALPDRTQIDPTEFSTLLAGISLIDVVRSPLRYRFRLLGERMKIYHGRDLTGVWLDDAFPHFNETTTPADFADVAEKGVPSYRIGRPLMTYEKSFIEMERIYLPFRDGGPTVDTIMAYTIFR